MYIFGNEISEPVYFGLHYLDLYILGNEKLLDVYFRDKPSKRSERFPIKFNKEKLKPLQG